MLRNVYRSITDEWPDPTVSHLHLSSTLKHLSLRIPFTPRLTLFVLTTTLVIYNNVINTLRTLNLPRFWVIRQTWRDHNRDNFHRRTTSLSPTTKKTATIVQQLFKQTSNIHMSNILSLEISSFLQQSTLHSILWTMSPRVQMHQTTRIVKIGVKLSKNRNEDNKRIINRSRQSVHVNKRC